MNQKIKGAIDSRIAEEQARARILYGESSPSRSQSGTRRTAARAISPNRKPRQGSRGRPDGPSKGPDPADFDSDFAVGDDELSRSGTPKPAAEQDEKARVAGKASEHAEDGQETLELPADVRVRLRKLDKLETRYGELLRSYRIAHAKVQTIDKFETQLKENTPLTTIADPDAFVEYLNQINLKGDMVLDELKRVSNDRDSLKHRLDEAEKRTKEAYNEVTKLRTDGSTDGASESREEEKDTSPSESQSTEQSDDPLAAVTKSPSLPARSPAIKSPTIPGMSMFSPKLKSFASPKSRQNSEDLFSYDGEIPRLEGEVQSKQERIEELERDIKKLKTDLAVTRESTQSMVQTLEEATRETNLAKESRERSEEDFRERQDALQRTADNLRDELQAAEAKGQKSQQQETSKNDALIADLREQLETATNKVKVLENTRAELDSKKAEIAVLQHKVSQLGEQLSNAESGCEQKDLQTKNFEKTISSLRVEIQDVESRNNKLTIELTKSLETLQTLRQESAAKEEATKAPDTQPTEAPRMTNEASGPSKKKNKKKKKAAKSGATQVQDDTEDPSKVAEPDAGELNQAAVSNAEILGKELETLQQQLMDKDAALESIRAKLKDQDDLKEEIETLRESLTNVGQEHVEAKEEIKRLMGEKRQLGESILKLETQLANAQGAHEEANNGSEQKHKDLTSQFEDLKVKASAMQTDLSAAQQLASARFKDLENLRGILQKAQPEINTLRNEAAGMKNAKESLAKRDLEFKALESRHEEMRSEVTKLKQSLSSREAEIISLNQQSSQEAGSRAKADEALSRTRQNIQRLEAEKRQATESLERVSKELSKVRDDLASHKSRLREIEQQYSQHRSENAGLREEVDLKSAQYASAQSLMASMRDQTSEMAIQVKEARDRCESLDEEVADAHRLLSERSREGETMRRLISDVEGRTEIRIREMKERMDTAIEERDRAEEEASTSGRRRARELEDLRNKLRDLERSLKRAEEDKDELDSAQRDWKRRREELEFREGQSKKEVEEMRKAMGDLRDALDESERQARDLEKQKMELRRSVEETQHRLEKLQKSNKVWCFYTGSASLY